VNLDLTRVLDCGKSILPVPAVEQPGGADRSEPERQSNGAIQAVALVQDRPIALDDLETFLNLLEHAAGTKLLSLKGLVALADDPDRPLALHSGRPAIYPLRRLATWPSRDRRTRMIAITHDLDPAALQRLFTSVTRPWPDRMRLRVAMAATTALVVVFAVGLAFALHSNARITMEASSTAPWMQDRSF
jgi:G3E family GTPase